MSGGYFQSLQRHVDRVGVLEDIATQVQEILAQPFGHRTMTKVADLRRLTSLLSQSRFTP